MITASLGINGFLLIKMVPKITPFPVAIGIFAALVAITWKSIKVLCQPVANVVVPSVGDNEDTHWRIDVSWSAIHVLALFFLAVLFTWSLWLLPFLLAGLFMRTKHLPHTQAVALRSQLKSILLNDTATSTLMFGVLLGLIIWFVRRRYPDRWPFGWFNRHSVVDDLREGLPAFFKTVVLSTFAMLAYRAGVKIIVFLLHLDAKLIGASLQHLKVAERFHEYSWVLAVGSLFLAPITEEIFFRGMLYRGFRKRCSMEASTAVTALLFALAHFRLYYFLPTFVMGMVACEVYEKRKSLVAPISLHLICNFTALVGWFLFPQVSK